MAINLRDLDPAVESVLLPSGREVPVYPADAGTVQLLRELELNPEDEARADLCLRRMIPDSTPEERLELTPPMVNVICLLSTKRIAEVEKLLGESSGTTVETENSTPPSSPPITTDSSAPASPDITG
jgi:hypothetical protein